MKKNLFTDDIFDEILGTQAPEKRESTFSDDDFNAILGKPSEPTLEEDSIDEAQAPIEVPVEEPLKNFEKRMQDPSKFIENPDGSISTHKMAWKMQVTAQLPFL